MDNGYLKGNVSDAAAFIYDTKLFPYYHLLSS